MSLFDQQPIAGPQFSEAAARALVQERYGLEIAAIASLGSFQDQNFRITAADGRRYVFKIANAATEFAALDLQNRALMHLAARDPAFPTPRLIAARDGSNMLAVDWHGAPHLVRLLTFVPGQMLAQVMRAPSAALLAEIGRLAAALVKHLADFRHPGGDQPSQWDLQYAPEVIRAFLGYVADADGRVLIESLLARYEAVAAPLLPRLRKSMIHGDITSYNTLVRDRAAKTPASAEALVVAERMRERGVIVYPTGDDYNILKIKPPLVFMPANADFFVEMLDEVLREGV